MRCDTTHSNAFSCRFTWPFRNRERQETIVPAGFRSCCRNVSGRCGLRGLFARPGFRCGVQVSLGAAVLRKQAALAVGAGVALGGAVATVMAIVDWRLNPGGIFRDSQSTNWEVVAETALSWFLPVASASCIVAAFLLFLLHRRR